MQRGLQLSRRTLLHSLFGSLCARLMLAAAPVQSMSSMLRDFTRSTFRWRRYRVDAAVLLWGVPLFTKQGVGGAYASVETGSIDGSSVVALQFAAGSWPNHARGLNRFGIWREVRLEIVPRTHLERPFLVTEEVNSREARLRLSVEVLVNTHSLNFPLHSWNESMFEEYRNAWTSKPLETSPQFRVQLVDKRTSRQVLTRTVPLPLYEGRNWVEQEIRVPSPKLWWPNGMGSPDLYRVKLTLLEQEDSKDQIEFDFGIRTI